MAQIAAHLAHDGFPAPVRAMAKHPILAGLAELCFAMLRHNARDRPTAAVARKELARLTPELSRATWPVELK